MQDPKILLTAILLAAMGSHAARNQAILIGSPSTSTVPLPPPTVAATMAPSRAPTLPMDLDPCPAAASTVSPLGRLRTAMRNTSFTQMNTHFDAFLVFHSDEHLSEEPAAEERRLEYISGWDGVGTAAVLSEGPAAIWVPSADVNRAKEMLSCAWIVIDADDPSQPSIAEFLTEGIGRAGRVGGDARLTSFAEWQNIAGSLQRGALTLVPVPTLLDQLWAEEPDPSRRRPESNRIVANMHNMAYTGLQWREKVALLRHEINQNGADAMVVTALDEVAWLLNVRGRDVPYAPLLRAFVIVSLKDVRVYAPPGKVSMPVREALGVYTCYTNNNCTRINDYTAIYSDLRRATESKILIPTGGTFQRGASAAIAQSVPQNKRLYLPSPIIYLKAQKNEAEIKGMHKAHVRDAVAMCTLLSYMEGMMKTGLTEVSVALKVDITRATQAGYVGLSMGTRVAFGPHGAELDYRPTNLTNRRIYTNSTLVIRSGGQYDEGTTVVTRTLHYGTPSKDMRAAYTTVLRSLAAIGTLQIPATLPAAHTDPVARAPLWTAKQDYPHPTGHGIGAALNRREDPVVIDYRQDTNLHTFRDGYFIVSEPAWYERNKYGVCLGNVLELVSRPDGYLGFKEATLIPFEPKLIDKSMLTEYEIKWLNAYNERIRKQVGPELHEQGLLDVYYWMYNKTIHIDLAKLKKASGSGSQMAGTWSVLICIAAVFLYA